MREVLTTVFTVEHDYLRSKLAPAFYARAEELLDQGLASNEQGVLSTLLPELPDVTHVPTGYDCILSNMLSCDSAAAHRGHTESLNDTRCSERPRADYKRSCVEEACHGRLNPQPRQLQLHVS